MTLLTFSLTIAAFYAGTFIGAWLGSRGRESAYLEGAKDGIGFASRRAARTDLLNHSTPKPASDEVEGVD